LAFEAMLEVENILPSDLKKLIKFELDPTFPHPEYKTLESKNL